MPKRWKRGARDDDAPSGTPWPLAVETPAPPSRSRAEQLMQRLWKGELEGETSDGSLSRPVIPHPSQGTAKGYSSRGPRSGEAFFPVMSSEELAPLLVPLHHGAEKIKATFQDFGVCIVTDVLSNAECAAFEELWHHDLLRLLDGHKVEGEAARQAQNVQQDLKAWPQRWDQHLGIKGMASKHDLPHGSFAWAARMHPKVRQVFADLYESSPEDLVVGLDNVFWCSAQEEGSSTNPEWLHVDQNHRTGMTWPCAQGVLYIWPSEGSSSSTTVVWPKSHKEAYEKMMDDPEAITRGRSMGGQSVKLKELQLPYLREELLSEALLNSRRVPCPAGSLLLWDSRTVHQGWRGGPRLAQPICWEPRERRSEEALHRKLWMCGSGIASSHSAAEGRVHGMAKEAPSPSLEEGLPLLRACLVPYGIASGQEINWVEQHEAIWPSDNPKRQADVNNLRALLPLLRPEMEEVL